MGMICVNEFDTSVDADAGVPRCVASWSHTQDQVVYALYLLAGLLALSLVWMTLSRRQRRSLRAGEIGFSLSYRRWARTSRAAAIIVRTDVYCCCPSVAVVAHLTGLVYRIGLFK